jgi:REP element-mobilizing transposase RayT
MDNQILEEGLTGIVAGGVRKLIRGICKEHEVEILKGHVSKDHVHAGARKLPLNRCHLI